MKNLILIALVLAFQISSAQNGKAATKFQSNLNTSEFDSQVVEITIDQISKNKGFKFLKKDDQDKVFEALIKYADQLKLNMNLATHRKALSETIDRLMNSSTQFLVCSSEDWECLEKKPILQPKSDWRQDISDDLGKPILAGKTPNINVYFTTAWADIALELNKIRHIKEADKNKWRILRDEIVDRYTKDMRGSRTTVAEILARKIKEDAQNGLWMSMYGIDDIEGSMKDVFSAIVERKEKGLLTKAVVDVADEGAPNQYLREYDFLPRSKEEALDIIDKRIALVAQFKKIETLTTELEKTLAKEKIYEKVKLLETELAKLNQQKSDIEKQVLNLPALIKEQKDNSVDFSYVNPQTIFNWFFGPSDWQSLVYEVGGIFRSRGQTFNVVHDSVFLKSEQDKNTADLVWLMGLNKTTQADVVKAVRSGYQYDATIDLLKAMNADAKSNEDADIHIEWPAKGIMHNKFMILEDSNNLKRVWTGTTNVARTCMGDENNSNMAIYIQNNAIASAFLTEFNEMYSPTAKDEKNLATGMFHTKKRPNTKRYFKFEDGTEIRVHFSPTDDGEHRAILPMLFSAKKGDTIRISMFGGSGLEYVRAMQKAVARGAHIKIVMDTLTGSGNTMWPQSQIANILENNPYVQNPEGTIEIRYSEWLGQNHHKTATLTRSGKSLPEYLIVGSQNWSEGGNDMNDENMMTIRNKNGLPAAKRFNNEFDKKMWTLSIPFIK